VKRQGKQREVRQGRRVWVAGLLGGKGIPCRQRGAAAGVTGRWWTRLAEAGAAAAACKRNEDGRQRRTRSSQWSRQKGRSGSGAGEAGRGQVVGAGKNSRLTIVCDATGAGSSLYFRALSGTCFCDMTVVIARWWSKDPAQKARARSTRVRVERQACAISRAALAGLEAVEHDARGCAEGEGREFISNAC
jgi:hypothetical protein